MVSSVSSAPYFSYLTQLQGGGNAAAANKPDANSAKTTSASLVSSLLGTSGYSSSVLSLLQQNGSGSFDPTSSLLGGQTTDTAITKLYSGIYDSATAATLQKAQTDATPAKQTGSAAAPVSSVQSLIDNATTASVAYNQTLQQNAANAVAASKARTDAITSIVS